MLAVRDWLMDGHAYSGLRSAAVCNVRRQKIISVLHVSLSCPENSRATRNYQACIGTSGR